MEFDETLQEAGKQRPLPNDLETRSMKCCCFRFYSEVKLANSTQVHDLKPLTRSLVAQQFELDRGCPNGTNTPRPNFCNLIGSLSVQS